MSSVVNHYLARLAYALMAILALISLDLSAEPESGNGRPHRVVVIGGAVTEIIYALGLADRIVAVDSTSRYPAAATVLPNVGYMRALGAEPIISLDPDMVLAVADAGPAIVFEQLAEAGIHIERIPDQPTLQGVLDKVDAAAVALGESRRGKALKDQLAAEFEALRDLPSITPPPRVLFLMSVGTGTPMVGGRDTAAAGIIELAGGSNAMNDFDGYRPMSAEAGINARPDVILVTDRTLKMLGGTEVLLKQPWIAATPAAQNRRIVSINGLLLLGFGSRTATAVRRLAHQLHSTTSVPATAK